ncbi:hypothetical protein C0W92_14180 [Photobacterium angustum]|uniref:Carbamoyltransferase Kae1-like domain-containing protein n=1 Tax=Photobacterium angustum TaxID=661 RepID=A0A855SAB7_PHOAN|nr:hypothetical protein [Photobacterium angustum]KJF79586.1 hypothetical protein UB36_21620 [Photobacterium damselae subsp. damselae]KJG26904.1 hypothetical protein UA69_21300 [Photobacterium angustum]KJG35073.1 hypothetical protein UA35_21570 [Photobacterium angustum]KJG42373.1 hypothetical protein UA31_21625 [Photobacterium angustum]KJG44004.1 hypothetical protein UA30_21505 [Photobacterium angustum]
MKLVQFSFKCSRQVPFYAQLCNDYLANEPYEITIGFVKNRYLIEAVGEQAQLEALAEKIAHDFLLSIWLVESKVEEIIHREGSVVPLINTQHHLPFCQHCEPLLGDNQSPRFGELALPCACCHGEQRLHQAISINQVKVWANDILTTGNVLFTLTTEQGKHQVFQLSTTPVLTSSQERPQILICNPNNVPLHFFTPSEHVLALSSLEKPRVTVQPRAQHRQLQAPLYDLCFSYNRVLTVLTEILRQQGVDFVFIDTNHWQPLITWIEKGWSQVDSDPELDLPVSIKALEPLHDQACINGLNAYWHKRRIHFDYKSNHPNDVPSHALPICALHGGNIESGNGRNTAVIYFGRYAAGEIVCQDKFTRTDSFLVLPSLPQTGHEIIRLMATGEQAAILAKFKESLPYSYQALSQINLADSHNQLSGLFAVAATILGLSTSSTNSIQYLNDALIAKALQNSGQKGHRVDYSLDMVDGKRTIEWAKTLGSLMSFCLVVNESELDKLAFGIMDSLADYIANWLERIDETTGLNAVVLAGSDFANEVLTERLSLRVGKNFTITVNRQLELDGSNLSAGALYLKMRRR